MRSRKGGGPQTSVNLRRGFGEAPLYLGGAGLFHVTHVLIASRGLC